MPNARCRELDRYLLKEHPDVPGRKDHPAGKADVLLAAHSDREHPGIGLGRGQKDLPDALPGRMFQFPIDHQ
jgi:hypothetical protein